eukprot:471757_1
MCSVATGRKVTTETSHIVDVTPVISKIEKFQKGEYAVYKFCLDNLNIEAEFYPKGITKSKPNWCAFFITIPNVKETDKRKLKCSIGFVYELFDESFNPVNIWRNGRGYSSFTHIDNVKKDPFIPITLKLYHNPLFIATSKKSFQTQLHSMYKLSQLNGDITLSIVVNNSDDNDGLTIYTPPNKKRKLMDNKYDINTNNDVSTGMDENVQTMKVSSIILQSGSKVFHQMLANNMMEKKEKKITVFAESMQDVDDMIYFMVTNILRKNANALSLIRLAHYYEIERLVMACLNRMIETLSVSTFCTVVSTFDRYSIEHGYNTLVEFGKKNVKEIRAHPSFGDLSHAFKCIVLGSAKD